MAADPKTQEWWKETDPSPGASGICKTRENGGGELERSVSFGLSMYTKKSETVKMQLRSFLMQYPEKFLY